MKRAHLFLWLIPMILSGVAAPFSACSQAGPLMGPDLPPGYVLKFERTGGYAGVHDAFWIYPDGRVINGAGKTARLHPGVVREWLEKLSREVPEGSTALKRQNLFCMDCLAYRITLYGGDGVRTLTFADPLERDPDSAGAGVGPMREQLLEMTFP